MAGIVAAERAEQVTTAPTTLPDDRADFCTTQTNPVEQTRIKTASLYKFGERAVPS